YCFVGKYFYLSKTFVENYKIDYKKFSYINFGIDRDMYASSNNINLKNVLNNYRIDINNDISLEKLNDLKNNSNLVDYLEEAKYKNKLSFIESFDLDKNKSLNPYSIFDMQLTMFHEAKRQLLNAINIASIYYMLKENSNISISPTTYIFSGKANDGYYMAKEIIKFIFALKHMIDKDRLIKEKIKIIFIEDLNVEKLKLIYPACDVYSNLTLPIFDNQSFEMMHSIFNFSNVISSKGGVLSNFNKENKIYTFGKTYDELVMTQKTYSANDFYYKNDIIKITVDNLINEDYNNLPYNFKNIFDYIISYNDSFLIFKDNKDLLETRLKLGKDYLDKRKWINNEIANILWAKEFNLGKNLEILK
uniref:glycogen/starch/alpha-glucan phosphorylase n=1 Tax=Anaerococcus hydrogenalis TaxID=33029 RepID=UPI0023F4532A